MEFRVFETRAALGAAAAAEVAAQIRALVARRGRAVGLFASAPSQKDTWHALLREAGIDWSRLTAFHLDEYAGFDKAHPHSLRRYLETHFLARIPIAAFHGLSGEASRPSEECQRYTRLLASDPPDFALIGIGENGHLAFNDPHVADFEDPLDVKIVDLDEACRLQQVHDGAFGAMDEAPRQALTVTIPPILRVGRIFVVVPGSRKRAAVTAALRGPISTECPASILRAHPQAALFLDAESAPG